MLEGVKTKCRVSPHSSFSRLFPPVHKASIQSCFRSVGPTGAFPWCRGLCRPRLLWFFFLSMGPRPRLAFFPWFMLSREDMEGGLPSSPPWDDASGVLIDPVSLPDSLSGDPRSSLFLSEVECSFSQPVFPLALGPFGADRSCLAFTDLSSARPGSSCPQGNQVTLFSPTPQSPGLPVPRSVSGRELHTSALPQNPGNIRHLLMHSFIYSFIFIRSFNPQTFTQWVPCTRYGAKCPCIKHRLIQARVKGLGGRRLLNTRRSLPGLKQRKQLEGPCQSCKSSLSQPMCTPEGSQGTQGMLPPPSILLLLFSGSCPLLPLVSL